MADTPLADFLAEIAQDDELLSNFNGMSLSEADSFLASRNLTSAQRAAVLSRDVTRICAHLTREQPDWGTKQFLVPAGPTMGPPTPGAPPPDLGFAAAPQGTMDPVALDTFAPLGGTQRSKRPTPSAGRGATKKGPKKPKKSKKTAAKSSSRKSSTSRRPAKKAGAKKRGGGRRGGK